MISNDVVILTSNEFRERLDLEFRRGVASARENRDALFERADLIDHGTGVTHSSDGLARIGVHAFVGSDLGDFITVRWHNEVRNPDHIWYEAHFSPARAKIIAQDLNLKASCLEEQHYGGPKKLDPLPEKMRHGPIG